ncbi:MAG: BMP family protein [Hylemonella sp.]|nr:BMP family protein [Hylemonella sp.]
MSARIAVVLFGPEGRGSFNESGWEGAQRARAAGHTLEVHWIAPLDGAQRAEALRALCAQGLDLLVAHGGQGDVPVGTVAPEFPRTRFAITQGHFLSANTACYEVLQEHSAFLAGVLAGLASQTRVVGHMSGEKVRPGLKGRAAFAHGLRSVAPDCRFVTHFCGQQHNPELAYEVTRALQREGADLVFAMIDGGRDGVSRACREWPIRQIGNVLDWVARDPEVFVASALAHSGLCVFEAIDDFVAGRFQPGSLKVHGLEDPAYVGLSMSPDGAARFGPQIEAWRKRLMSGEVVPDEDFSGPEMAAVV